MDFLTEIRSKLLAPLNAERAHREMYPSLLKGDRFKFSTSSPPGEAAVLLLLFPNKDGSLSFPLIKRAEYPGVHSGQIAFPGGKKETIDIDLTATSVREAHEEVGIIAEDVEIIGELSEIMVEASNTKVKPVVASINYTPAFLPQEEEVAEIIQVDLQQFLFDTPIIEREISIGADLILKAPCFDIDGHTVWGATSMMLNEFRRLFSS